MIAVMKKSMFLTAIVAVFTLASCQIEFVEESVSEEVVPAELVQKEFRADYEEDVESKTVLDGATAINWTNGEEIVVFDDVAGKLPAFTSLSSGATTTFSGSVSPTATEYFAMSPFQEDATIAENVISATIPQVQYAVEGGFDPRACLAVAYTTPAEDELNFKLAVAFLKVTIPSDDVIAVEFSADCNQMTGSMKITVKKDGSNPSMGVGSGTKYKNVVLRNEDFSPLTKDATYYVAVRPASGSNTFANFTARVFKTGDAVGTKASTKTLTVSRKSVIRVPFPSIEYSVDRYTCYEFGLPVTIAGATYNKATNGAARLLADSYVVKNGDTGVLFVEASASVSNTSEYTINGDVVLASNDPDRPATYTGTSEKSLLVKSGSLVMDNLKVNMAAMTSGQFFAKKDNDGNFSSLTLWQCDFSNVARPVYAPNSSYLNNGIEDILINGCRFGTTTNVQLFSIGSGATTLAGYKTFTFTNNVLYSTGDAQTGTYVFYTTASGIAESTCVQDLIMDNNLFYNVPNGNGLFRTHYLKSAYIRNNVLWAQDGSYSSNSKMFKTNLTVASAAGGAFEGASSDNYCYGSLGDKKSWTISDADCRGPLTNVTTLDANPIASFNTSTGEFEMIPAYASYGPRLQPN